jgi:purine-binding chemotaxis protein CheW
MCESKIIADHDDALSIYFEEILVEATADTLKNKAPSMVQKPMSERGENVPFRVLLFDLNGLQLAMNTEDVKAILPWPALPLVQNQQTKNKPVFMGSYNQIKIINTAHIMLPIKHQHDIAEPNFIIVVGAGEWALSCHKINAVIDLLPQEIRWRNNIGTRPWLAGMSIEKSCSIINITELENLLS